MLSGRISRYFEGGIQSQKKSSCCYGCNSREDVYVVPKHRIVGVDIVQTSCLFNFKQRTYVHFKLKKPKTLGLSQACSSR